MLNIKVNGDFNICSGKSIKIIDVFNLIKHSLEKKSFNKLKIKNRSYSNEIIGSVQKLKKFDCFLNTDIKKDIKAYLKSIKYFSPQS